jgi:hypothetical protein
MEKAFLFVCSRVEVDRDCKELSQTIRRITSCTRIIQTPELTGVGVEVAGTIVTSLFLVKNHEHVNVIGCRGGSHNAEVVDVDIVNYLAKLRVTGRCNSDRLTGIFSVGNCSGIGSVILVAQATRKMRPAIMVGGMQYTTTICKRKQDTWKINGLKPVSLFGSGVWNGQAEFLGLTIGSRQHLPSESLEDDPLPRIYSVPAETVLEFAETN